MPGLTLIIGNKNYSSWSLRPWILLRHLGLEFTEQQIPLDLADSAARIRAVNPAGRVPVLRHGELVIWESIAIGEYLCELAGEGLPTERAARARARSVSAEMHAGFHLLRMQWPMNARTLGRRTAMSAALQDDVTRIDNIWCECRERHGASGPWMFGDNSLADAALQEWLAAAAAEPWFIAGAEVGA